MDRKQPKVYAQGRFDLKTLAQIGSFLAGKSRPPRTKSELLFEATEVLGGLISKAGGVRPETYGEAIDTLRTLGIEWGEDNHSRRGIVESLQVDALIDFADSADPDDPEIKMEDLIAEAKRRMAEHTEDKE